MGSEPQDAKPKVTLEEIQKLHDRLGIPRGTNDPGRSLEEYAWKYGFRPEAKRHGITLDPHTRLSR